MDRKHGKGLIFAMTNRERIEDNYEDALFAVWMDDFARRLGAKYMEENERLNNTPEAAVPQPFSGRIWRLSSGPSAGTRIPSR